MPPRKEGQLSGAQAADVTAFILQVNKFPAGQTELATTSMMLKQIKYVAQGPGSSPDQGAWADPEAHRASVRQDAWRRDNAFHTQCDVHRVVH